MIAAIVVLFHPDQLALERLQASLIGQVETILMIDNTPGSAPPRPFFLSELVTFIPLGVNKGIAEAQNIGINWCFEHGYTHVLFLDHDSAASPHMVSKLLAAEQDLLVRGERVAAITPQIIDERTGTRPVAVRYRRLGMFGAKKIYRSADIQEPEETDIFIASGSLMRLRVLETIGVMRSDLFIEYVDTEWALRARSEGFKSFCVPWATLIHNFGDGAKRMFGKDIYLYNDLRYCYKLRNSLYLLRLGTMGWRWRTYNITRIPYHLMVYSIASGHPLKTLALLFKAMRDGWQGKLGPYSTAPANGRALRPPKDDSGRYAQKGPDEHSGPPRLKRKSMPQSEAVRGGMKLAILGTRGIPASYGGFETFAERLATGLCSRGFEVTVFCEATKPSPPAAYHGVRLRYIASPVLGPLSTILFDAKCLWSARKEFDLVYMLGYGAAPFCLIPRLWNTEVWINPDGLEWARAKWNSPAKFYFRLMEWVSLHIADRVIADANAIAASLAGRHGPLRSCTVIPYGCDVVESPPPLQLLSEWSLGPRDYYLIVCRLEPENHVLEILQAFQQSSSNKQLIIAGDHRAKTRYIERLLSIRDPRLRFIGTVYDPCRLTALRYHAFAYMHGHSVGGTNPSLLEAMGCGNLIFAHDNPFNRETLGPSGFYFANAIDLSFAIDRAEQADAELEPLREATRIRARSKYQWCDIVTRYESLLREMPPRAKAA